MNQFNRLELLIGEKINLIKDKILLIIGLGGVGGYAVEALARSGIGNFIIVDNDIINISNLNRQIIATIDTIGQNKTDVVEKRISSINPKAHITKVNKFITLENINELFKNNIDYVVDACDTVEVKFELIKLCKEKNIKLISCMGTGNKMDPTRFKIIDIRKTCYDKLAKKLRKMVNDEKIKGKIMVVSSDEVSYTKIVKEIPSNAFVPATAGLLCASYIINDIVGENNV